MYIYVLNAEITLKKVFSGHVRTVLLQQKQRLLGDSDGVKIIANGSEFYTLTTTASPAHAVIRPPTFTLRSVRSANSGYSSTRQGAGMFSVISLTKSTVAANLSF